MGAGLLTQWQWCETDNPLWGLTTNPVHKDYTPGGSTGGESALLASKASMVGWGTDIGGSIRIPSHMMGLYGFKPSVREPSHGRGYYREQTKLLTRFTERSLALSRSSSLY